jgi:hypothetical protein
MKFLLLAIVSFLIAVIPVKSQNCTSLANNGDCLFYTHCVQPRLQQCGGIKSGFLSNYAHRYCSRFNDESDCFTQTAQGWIISARICQMQAILNSDVYISNGTCGELETFVFENYPTCSVNNGFCGNVLLNFTNLRCIALNVYTFNDNWNRRGIQQVLDTAGRCSRPAANIFLSLVSEWLQNIEQVYGEFLEILRDFLGSCNSGIDIVFVLDSSGSVGAYNFQTMKIFVKNVIYNFNIGANQTRVGVINFSSAAYHIIQLGSENNASSLYAAVDAIQYIGGGTRTHLALDLVRTIAFNDSRLNEGIPRIAIVLTDGKSNIPESTIVSARLLHATGITIYALGIGSGVNVAELNIIANSSSNVFEILNFTPEAFAAILLQLQTTACTTPAEADLNDELDLNLGMNEIRLIKFPFPDEGMTLKMNISVGQLVVHGSFTINNPNMLTADFSVTGDENEGIDFFISPQLYANSTTSSNSNGISKRAFSTESNVYLSITGLKSANSFVMNTTLGDTVAVKSPSEPTEPTEPTKPASGVGVTESCFYLLSFSLLFYLSIC